MNAVTTIGSKAMYCIGIGREGEDTKAPEVHGASESSAIIEAGIAGLYYI